MWQAGAYRKKPNYCGHVIKGTLVLPGFLSPKLCQATAQALMLSFLDMSWDESLPECPASGQGQKELANESWIAICKTVTHYKPSHLLGLPQVFWSSKQVYQQMEPVTKCKHQGVDVKSVSPALVAWGIFFIWEVKLALNWMA